MSFGVQQVLSPTPPPSALQQSFCRICVNWVIFCLLQHRGLKDNTKTYVLSKASLTFFPLAERKLDLKSMELSRRMREAELWKC